MKNLKSIIENTDTTLGKVFDLFIQTLILISLICFSIETLPNLTAASKSILWTLEFITVVIFTIEYLLRILVADHKIKFIFSFFGFIDFVAILPFYLTLGLDLRSIRLFRMLRMLRVLKLARYSRAATRFYIAFKLAREEFILYFITMLLILYLTGVGIYYFENPIQPEKFSSVIHSLWWAVATLTTVGYGDIYPVTIGGKIFTFFVLIVGLGIVSIPAGIVASALAKAREMEK